MADTPSGQLKSDRRRLPDRRGVGHGGRGDSDPAPSCPSCGFPTADGAHNSHAACIAALGTEIARLAMILLEESEQRDKA